MAVYKDKKAGSWFVSYYQTNSEGKDVKTTKRGFKTKKEAVEWEAEYIAKKKGDLSMTFASFVELYREDLGNRLRLHTWENKNYIIDTKLVPYFGKKRMSDITRRDIINWQNQMMSKNQNDGKGYSKDYLKTIHNQLSAIFNHAVRFYGLKVNYAALTGNMAKSGTKEMDFWTKEEYFKFSEAIMDKPVSFYAFEVLYWCGLRISELLALTKADFNVRNKTIRINKALQRIRGENIITDPKTPKSKRTIVIPEFLIEELVEYINSIPGLEDNDRLFDIKKRYLENEIKRGAKAAGIKVIRVHDLRHSHVSLLINMGFTAIAIADRVGHESIDITYRYAHLFPSVQTRMALMLNVEKRNNDEEEDYVEEKIG